MRHRLIRILPYAFQQWPTLLVLAVLTVISSALAALQPWPLKLLVDTGLRSERAPGIIDAWMSGSTPAQWIIAAAAASLCLFAVNSAIGAVMDWCWAFAGNRMVFGLACDVFAKLQRLSMLYHSRNQVGDSLSRVTVDTWSVYTLAAGLLIAPVQQLATLAVVAVTAWSLNPMLAMVSLALAPLLGLSGIYFGRLLKSRAKSARAAQSRIVSFVQQTLSVVPLVQAFGTASRNKEKFRCLAEEAVGWSQWGAVINSSLGMVNGLITTAGLAVVLFAGGTQVMKGKLTLGGLLVFLAYMRTLQQAAGGLLQTYGALKPVEAGLERVVEILDLDEPVKDAPAARSLHGSARGHIRFENVTFGYEPGRPILQALSFEARPGERIALVGATGSGKTTTVSLIPRFYDVWDGRILFDDIDVRDLQIASLRREISIVMQEPFLMPLSIGENIAYGRPGASRDEIVEAAIAANADEFIRRLPRGYDTPVGERGVTLSGGERQRIAIARALLKNAAVLILDEPTSALDVGTEVAVMEALERLMQNRTTIVIAHRLSTVESADRIIVLSDGAAAECGTHSELLAHKGIYRRLHHLQVRGTGA